MHFRSEQQTIRLQTVMLGLALTGVLFGTVWADPPATQPAGSPAGQAPAEKKDPPAAKTGLAEQVREPAGQTVTPAPQRARTPRSEYPPDPNAKWACDKTEVVLDPIWRKANATLSFDFTIRNEGTADLKINAKGGG
jgi:hypothetical protein